MKVLGLIPARKGSKSILNKNTAMLGGKPLIKYVIDAVKGSDCQSIICSTNDEKVMEICDVNKVFVQERSDDLCRDDTPILDVIKYVLSTTQEYDFVALLQPTSPFVTSYVINYCIKEIETYSEVNSIQTITQFPHNFHAFNQRKLSEDNYVSFVFKEQRERCYNKQLKPPLFIFGNLVITRVSSIDLGIFAEPSIGVQVTQNESIDIDTKEDLEFAELYLRNKQEEVKYAIA